MRSLLSPSAALALALVLAPVSGASAADSIGSAITVSNIVTAELQNDKRRLSEGDDVHQNELIEVAEDSLGELRFRDQTKLALGAGSRVVLDKYVYDPDKTAGSIVMNLVRGTFRFITGVAAKPTYQIKTPHASISVRGTIFDVYVQDDGAAWLLLIEGSLVACNDRGRCQVLDEPGKLIRIDEAGNVGKPTPWKRMPGKRDIKFERAYPFFSQPTRIAEIPDFTDEIVSVGTIPPIVFWPRHPRWPHRPPGDGRWPGGDGKNPYPGKDPPGGKTPTTGTPGSSDGPVILKRGKHGKPILTKKPTDAVGAHKKSAKVYKSKPAKVVRHKTPTVKHASVKTTRYKTGKTGSTKMTSFRSNSFKATPYKASMPKASFGGFRMGRR